MNNEQAGGAPLDPEAVVGKALDIVANTLPTDVASPLEKSPADQHDNFSGLAAQALANGTAGELTHPSMTSEGNTTEADPARHDDFSGQAVRQLLNEQPADGLGSEGMFNTDFVAPFKSVPYGNIPPTTRPTETTQPPTTNTMSPNNTPSVNAPIVPDSPQGN